MHHQIIAEHISNYPHPIQLNAGDLVVLDKEEQAEKWQGWIWVENATNKGWAPKKILEILPNVQAKTANDSKQVAVVLAHYSAKELTVTTQDVIEKRHSLNGWTWSINVRTYDEGWLPDEVIGTALINDDAIELL